jgi:hypothetical protein
MQTYYTGEDIEDLAARGLNRLEIGSGVVLTDIARELANELGIELITVNAPQPPSRPAAASQPASPPAPLGGKPRGCQHGPVQTSGRTTPPEQSTASNGVVNRLVDMVSRLADRGS